MNKQYSNSSVLIFWASGRQAIPVIKGFYDIGAKVAVYCKSKLEPGYLTRYTSNRIVYNEKNQYSEKFYEYGARIIREGRFDIVIPLRDKAAIFLSQHKEELQKYAKIAVNDWDVIQYATDKSRTMSVCEKLGIPAPITVTGDQILKQIEEKNISFPVVVKPCTQGGSIGFNIFKDQEKLSEYLLKYDGRFGKLLVQEYIEQGNAPQYRADFFIFS